jgi:hypothetical protein
LNINSQLSRTHTKKRHERKVSKGAGTALHLVSVHDIRIHKHTFAPQASYPSID